MNPWTIFLRCSSAWPRVVAYLLYMMIRRRKGERPACADREPEL